MKLTVHWKDLPASPELRERLERRLGFALGRFGSRVRAVWARLSDENGPRGGIDKCCKLRLRGEELGPLTVEASDSDLGAAIDRAADRLGRAVARVVERGRSFGGGERNTPRRGGDESSG